MLRKLSLVKLNPTSSFGIFLQSFSRIVKYTLVRGFTLSISIVASVYLIIYIANLGGYQDTIQKALINESISGMLMEGWLRDTPSDERQQLIAEKRAEMEAAESLDQPYALRVGNWFINSITFNWGQSRMSYVISNTYVDGVHTQDVTTKDIKTEIISFLPRTLLLLGLSNLGIFLFSILIGILLTRSPGNWVDRLFINLAPISAAPAWLFGFILIIFFYRILGNYSFSLGTTNWRTTFDLGFLPILMRTLFLPFLAIFLSKFFQSVYAWRTYFLTFSNESYLELAKAKGLPQNMLERRYILRPALPSIITSFALIMISIWQECIAVEYFFNVGGIGSFFIQALRSNEIGVIAALVTTFAYFLAITIFILDIVYVLVDPRLKIQTESQSDQPYRPGSWSDSLFHPKNKISQPIIPYWQIEKPLPKVSHREGKGSFFLGSKKSWKGIKGSFRSMVDFLRDLSQFPSALVGLVIILVLVIVSISTMIIIPYNKVIPLWRGDDLAWITNPRLVPPAWTNFFRVHKLPENIEVNSQESPSSKVITQDSSGNKTITISMTFDYPYETLPQDILLLFSPVFEEINPYVSMTWITPDQREIQLNHFSISQDMVDLLLTDTYLVQKFGDISPVQALFGKPDGTPGQALQGKYELRINGNLFEGDSNLDLKMVVYGKVYGLAGTDSHRKDLMLVLLWGTAAALSFGILAALGTTFTSVTLAAAGVWFGGWVDEIIHRISEINMVLPILPISILIFYLYSKSFWVLLGVTVGLSIFGNSIKNYRAMFMQIKTQPYIECARSYGTSGWRIIFRYMIPRVQNVLIPQLIVLVPSYIFFEATLSFLGVSDPFLPTLGKQLVAALQAGMTGQPAYLLLEPVAMLFLIAVGFPLFGFALERLFNKKLGI